MTEKANQKTKKVVVSMTDEVVARNEIDEYWIYG